MAVELNALRDQIDAVDKQMLELLAQRLSLVEKVGEVTPLYPVKPLMKYLTKVVEEICGENQVKYLAKVKEKYLAKAKGKYLAKAKGGGQQH